jgi:hypothetical protein
LGLPREVRYCLPCIERGSYTAGVRADVAQLVERNLAKVEVAGSSPVVRSEARAFAVEWPRGEAAACKAAYTGSNPVSTSGIHRPAAAVRAIGAAVARFLDTEEVTGSNPVSPTNNSLMTCENVPVILGTWGNGLRDCGERGATDCGTAASDPG